MLQGIFALLNSKKNTTLEISSIILDTFNEQNLIINKKDPSSIHLSKNNSSAIIIKNIQKNKVNYELEGEIISEKTFLNSIEKIETETEIIDQIFYIKNKIKIKRVERKEFNNISVYSYLKKNTVKMSKNINFLKIELYVEIMNCEKPNEISLVAEEYITI